MAITERGVIRSLDWKTAARTGQVLTVRAPAPGVGFP